MDWEQLAANFGLPGLMLGAIVIITKLWITSNEKIQLEKTKVEDKKADNDSKKADAMVTALTTLSSKIDSHQVADITSHREMAVGIAELDTKLEALSWGDRTPVEGVPKMHGTYGPSRPNRAKSEPR
jgi:hypothetical protein